MFRITGKNTLIRWFSLTTLIMLSGVFLSACDKTVPASYATSSVIQTTIATLPPPSPGWREYETALVKTILWEDGFCEWEILGQAAQEVYVWAVCRTVSGGGASVPAVIYLAPDGKIDKVVIPRDGSNYGVDIQALFPPDVQTLVNAPDQEFIDSAWDHLIERQKDTSIPPLIVLEGVPLPFQTKFPQSIDPTNEFSSRKNSFGDGYIAYTPIEEFKDTSQEEIVNFLVTQWLAHYQTESAATDARLTDYTVDEITLTEKRSENDPSILAWVRFSILPAQVPNPW
ncbi:MAG TPA: hypothetical protein PK530_19895, partial [Anaerolineales bacterium]|nr:hypothetical protein [Anaerolineales bacterium]